MTAVFDAMAVEYETIQQRRLPVDGYYSESNIDMARFKVKLNFFFFS